jgi:hypothetical protein
MDAGRGNLEEALEVGLGRWAAVDLGVGVDERQILALQLGEVGKGSDRHEEQRVIRSALPCKEAWMNIRYVVELTEAERDELRAVVAKGSKLALR